MASILMTGPGERADFNMARAVIAGTPGISQKAIVNAVLTQSYVLSIVPLAQTQTAYTFQVLTNQNNSGIQVRGDEFRMPQQDAIFVTKVWFYLFNSATYNWVPKTYPSTEAFPTGAASLYAWYNANITVNTNNSTVVPGYPMRKFLQIPPTQFTAATNSPVDQFDGTLLQPWQPAVVLGGTYQTTFTVTLPVAMTTLDSNTYAAMYLEGIRAQNVCLGSPS